MDYVAYAVPFFLLLIVLELGYGFLIKKNNYRISDTLTSLSLGSISQYVPILKLGFQGAVFAFIADYFSLPLLSSSSWIVWVVAFILYDLCYYWFHRMHHEVKIFWASHVVHHHGEEFNLSTALRQTSSGFLWSWIFYIPLFVLGIPPEVFITVGSLNLIYQFWVHTEHVKTIGIFEYILVTPSNHRVHHAQNKEYIDANYGGVFIFWDIIFGTFIEEKKEVKPIYGTVKPLNSWNPIKANIDVYWLILRDSFVTKRWGDKFKVWFSDARWRPDDVSERFPVQRNDLSSFVKYDPKLDVFQKIYAFFQIFSLIIIPNFIVSDLDQQTNFQSLILIGNAVLFITFTLMYLEGKQYALWMESIRSISFIALIFFDFSELSLLSLQISGIHALVCLLYLVIALPLRIVKFQSA